MRGRGDRTDEPVASAMCGFDKAGMLRIVTERLPQLTNSDLQDAVADKGARPDGIDEFLFCHEQPGTAKEIIEQREHLWPEPDRL